MARHAIIIGAGPAGLTAAYELLKRTDIIPIILERSGDIGGISKTVNYKGNRIDMGGHRFFSKSDRVMKWWLNLFPIDRSVPPSTKISYRGKSRNLKNLQQKEEPKPFQYAVFVEPESYELKGRDPVDRVMLVRQRISRIFFLRQFFSYPIKLSIDTIRKLGVKRTYSILRSYVRARRHPRKEESLEDFFINRFGEELYQLFFKDYTEKVWGAPCTEISAEWGAQRIKGISVSEAISHAAKSMGKRRSGNSEDITQRGVETSMIEKFLYPKYGPGQLWEEVARQVEEMGGRILLDRQVRAIKTEGHRVIAVEAIDQYTGEEQIWEGDYFFSTMPVSELIAGMDGEVPTPVKAVAAGLQFRDFITVGLLLKKMIIVETPKEIRRREKKYIPAPKILPDTWIYVQEKDVKVGRLQIFNNWSPFLVRDPKTIWMGMEYFCEKTDAVWQLSDRELQEFAMDEMIKLGFIESTNDVLDSTVLRMEKAYPAYFGSYDRFDEIREFTDQFGNLFLVGRNGMHKYNNSDHSMLTAMVAVDNICAGIKTKDNLWSINTEQEYLEEKGSRTKSPPSDPPSLIDIFWNNKKKRTGVVAALALFFVQFLLFKLKYPFANFMPDSYSYLDAAASNANVSVWPIGYSKFLRLLSAISHSDTLVVGTQYLLLQCSALAFLLSFDHFIKPNRWVRVFLVLFFLLNPLALYISNYIASDALFISLSLLWFTQLLWIIYRPRKRQIFTQAILLLLIFTVRYNGIYYPLIAALAFILSQQGWRTKLAGIGLGIALIGGFMLYTSGEVAEATGQEGQFSPFGGWQLANNALYAYERVPPTERVPVPEEFAGLEKTVQGTFDTLEQAKRSAQDTMDMRFYLWNANGPLYFYLNKQWWHDSTASFMKRWASEGPLYGAYGAFLIRNYPGAFFREFILVNVMRFINQPMEFLLIFNEGKTQVRKQAKDWFEYKTADIADAAEMERFSLIRPYPFLAALINAWFVVGSIAFFVFGGVKQSSPAFTRLLLVAIGFWVINAGFSIFASPIVARYQVFPVLVAFAMGLCLLEFMFREQGSTNIQSAQAQATPKP